MSGAYLERSWTSTMKLFCDYFHQKSSIVDVWLGSKYTSEVCVEYVTYKTATFCRYLYLGFARTFLFVFFPSWETVQQVFWRRCKCSTVNALPTCMRKYKHEFDENDEQVLVFSNAKWMSNICFADYFGFLS